MTSPMKPLTSTSENPMKDQRIRVLDIEGFLLIPRSSAPNMMPTPTATPVKAIIDMLTATYLKATTSMQTPDSLMQYASLAYDCAAPRIRVGPAARGQPLRECAILVGTDWPAEWGINELWASCICWSTPG